jgi:hypothetical protein
MSFPAAVAAVPEPSTWTTMIMGFVGVGVAAYRRSRKTSSILVSIRSGPRWRHSRGQGAEVDVMLPDGSARWTHANSTAAVRRVFGRDARRCGPGRRRARLADRSSPNTAAAPARAWCGTPLQRIFVDDCHVPTEARGTLIFTPVI